uniref:Methyltransferase-like protein 13 n=1 Tax=Meloidogyne floridensis TaxID=298350 RepID=A0A915NTJ8_9BILA
VLVLFLLFRYYGDSTNREFTVHVPVQVDDENQNIIVHEVICPKGVEENCFKIEDVRLEGWNGHETEYERLLVVDKVEDVVLTIAKLIPKPGEKFSAKNSAGWPVMKKRLILAYIKAIAGQLLVSGCLEASKETPRILMLGLGGGTVPNFFDEIEGNREFISIDLEPAMEYISRKWFNLKNTPNQKVIIQDAIEYINNWKIEGTLIMNTFVLDTEENREIVAEERQFLLDLFRHHFGYCYYADAGENKVLVCNLEILKKGKIMTNKLYEEKVSKLPKWVQHEVLGETDILHKVWKKPNKN